VKCEKIEELMNQEIGILIGIFEVRANVLWWVFLHIYENIYRCTRNKMNESAVTRIDESKRKSKEHKPKCVNE
jgi:hypothetical protein